MTDEEKSADAANANHSTYAGLTGWPVLEQFVNELDTVMVNGHNDDINTFLTFAGLFSAVLTAFLAISFALLQPDGTDDGNQKLDYMSMALHQISMQLFNSSTPPLLPIPEDTASFKPIRSSIWINSLWFLSLVLSMAASLLGMIAKQWLREFLSWTTMSGLSERQVLLRHIRYEAFLQWHVPAIIASIPVLLETSLIMFLIGLCILLGTLNDRVVFGLCTAAVGILVILTITVTILPVKYPQCPYKLPAGWAILRGWQAVVFLRQRVVHTSRSLWRASEWKDWRQRELDDRKWVSTASTCIQEPYVHDDFGSDVLLRDHGTRNVVAHMKDLFYALKWITDTSQNMRILQAVEECSPACPGRWSPLSCLVTDLHVACELFNIDLCRLVPPLESCVACLYPLQGLRKYSRTVVKLVTSHWSSPKFQFQVLRVQGTSEVWEEHEQEIDVSPSMAIPIAHSIARHLSATPMSTWYDAWGSGGQKDYYVQAATALGCFLVWSTTRTERQMSSQLSSVIERFAVVFDKLTRIDSSSPLFPLCLPLYRTITYCEDILGRKFLLISEDAPRFTRLAVRFPLDDPAEWCKDECELFVIISTAALYEWATKDETVADLRGELLPPLFIRMQSCADRCRQTEEWSCIKSWPSTLHDTCRSLTSDLFPHELVHALVQCRDAARAVGVSTGTSYLDELVKHSQRLSNRVSQEADSQSTPRSQLVEHAAFYVAVMQLFFFRSLDMIHTVYTHRTRVHGVSSVIADQDQSLTSQPESPPVRPSDLLFIENATAVQSSEDIEIENLGSDNEGDAHESGRDV